MNVGGQTGTQCQGTGQTENQRPGSEGVEKALIPSSFQSPFPRLEDCPARPDHLSDERSVERCVKKGGRLFGHAARCVATYRRIFRWLGRAIRRFFRKKGLG